ncbi:LuxR family transcriptional regulator [Jannaschia sp. LMIT008]|uniref:helix-turn-helix transcriptional regulator n=1 Tax=Jannaschia maritima TaxID=3032585 RepID=UPI0028120F57|nr:LuxR family transcriptional regulator [Jannaschia sp. LMIT008]
MLDLLHRITQCGSVAEVWDIQTDYMTDKGFDRILYAATHFKTSSGAGDIKDALILTNYPKEFTDVYVDGGLFRDAPVVRWAMRETGSISWRAIEGQARNGELTEAEMKVVAFNKRVGVGAGYAVSFPRSSLRSGFGIGLGSTRLTQMEVDDLWAREGREIELVAHVCHLKIIALPHTDHIRVLTDRQREVLELVADGKTIQDVAILLERNPATVEKHLRLARDALDVETTAQAILKLSLQHQFFTISG